MHLLFTMRRDGMIARLVFMENAELMHRRRSNTYELSRTVDTPGGTWLLNKMLNYCSLKYFCHKILSRFGFASVKFDRIQISW